MGRRALLIWGVALIGGLAVACASGRGHIPHPFPTPAGSTDVRPGAPIPSSLVAAALRLRGTPYKNGGSDPAGFDCSGFTQYVFGQFNIVLPRETRDQFRLGQSVRLNELAPGDLLFFTTNAPGASHVGIAINREEFVHAPTAAGVVRVEQLNAD